MPRPAAGLFAFEFNESGKYGAGEYVSPLGEVFCNVGIAGAVTAVDVSPVSGKVTARVSDPTGVFLVDAGKKESATGRFFAGVPVPSFVSVTGRAESGDGMHIVAEAAVAVDRGMRDSWTGAVSRDTIKRIEAAPGGEDAGSIKELCRYAALVERALDAIDEPAGGGGGDTPAGADYTGKILEMIDLHSGNRGIPVDDLIRICTSSGIKEADVKRAIKSLVEDGECYLPAGGYIRRL